MLSNRRRDRKPQPPAAKAPKDVPCTPCEEKRKRNEPNAPLGEVSVIVPFYRNVGMLEAQIEAWDKAPDGYRFIVIDDGSPEPARDVIEAAPPSTRAKIECYRITTDIPWNRNGARNLGATVAETDWIVHIDIDHVIAPGSYAPLLDFPVDPSKWYRFPRWRVGAADETRRKDRVSPDAKYAQIHPHGDSFLITRSFFWSEGGYDERFSGCLGGGQYFVAHQLEKKAPVEMLPDDIRLHVYTRDVVKDASDWSLSRDPGEFTRRRKAIERAGTVTHRPLSLNFEWERVL